MCFTLTDYSARASAGAALFCSVLFFALGSREIRDKGVFTSPLRGQNQQNYPWMKADAAKLGKLPSHLYAVASDFVVGKITQSKEPVCQFSARATGTFSVPPPESVKLREPGNSCGHLCQTLHNSSVNNVAE